MGGACNGLDAICGAELRRSLDKRRRRELSNDGVRRAVDRSRGGFGVENGMAKVKPNPTRQSLEDLQRELDRKEKLQAIAQPHRRGDDSDMTDPLGMFVRIHMTEMFGREAHRCVREVWEGGWAYFRLVYCWRVATGLPVPLCLHEGETKNAGPRDGETIEDWDRRKDAENRDRLAKIKRCEDKMKCSGLPGFHAAQALILKFEFPDESIIGPVRRAIHSLAMEMGRFLD